MMNILSYEVSTERGQGHFNHFKNWRGLASRYDKYALVYRGGVVLAAIVLWLS